MGQPLTGPAAVGQSAARPAGVGIVGCGFISTTYVETLSRFADVSLVAAADSDPDRAATLVGSAPGVRALSVAELVAAEDVDLVLNLTVPAAHAAVSRQALDAGRTVYSEKPLAGNREDARALLAAARATGVRLGCAPDTVLGTGIQTARAALDAGLLGRPVAATAVMATPGHERWHPNPDFYYQPGGGPVLDMGPYYVTALVTLLGPVVSALGASSRSRDLRRIGSGGRAGELVGVGVDTHVTGVLTHVSGALSTLVLSFDVAGTRASTIEVHGEDASMVVPDPNEFSGEVWLREVGAAKWRLVPESAGYRYASRGYGVVDLVRTPAGAEPRAGGALAAHVLDVLLSLLEAARTHTAVPVRSTCERPRPVPLGELPHRPGP